MTTLSDVRDGSAAGIDLLAVKTKRALVAEIQMRLAALGLLDPPTDGDFGPVSLCAWRAFCDRQGAEGVGWLTADLARRLLSASPDDIYPLSLVGTDLASRVIRSMQALGYWIARHPDCVNVAYVEGHGLDGVRNDNSIDTYNDVRIVFRVRESLASTDGAWTATSQPGWHWILNPMQGTADPVKGAAQIALGQYKAWCVGTHHGSTPHEALVQRAVVRVHRDHDRNGLRPGDPVFERADYGINQHHGANSRKVGKYSAGCLVANSKEGHEAFMTIVKRDARYRSSNSYRFMSAVIGADQLLK